jgi:hydroxymethylbilane synthase
MTAPLRIATRGSRLALWQATHVADLLRPLIAPRSIELVEIKTTGDQVADRSLSVIGGQGVFTREIQQALLDGRANLAVHSLKDLPTEAVPGITLAAVPPRASTADALLAPQHRFFDALPQCAHVATGSSRRRAQLLHRRPDLQFVDLRGNVDTRVRKLREQGLDAMVLAEAGLQRIGLAAEITERLDPAWMLPAVGQGALGLECRTDDAETLGCVSRLDHPPSKAAVLAERAFLRALGGGCLLPIAALGAVAGQDLMLRGAILSPDGRQRLVAERHGPVVQAEAIGTELANELLAQGAAALLPGS